jgi:Innexin
VLVLCFWCTLRNMMLCVVIYFRMTKCTFHKFGASGNIEKHDAMHCHLFQDDKVLVLCFWCTLRNMMLCVVIYFRMTKCTFHKFGASGNIEKHDALCILPVNIGNNYALSFCFRMTKCTFHKFGTSGNIEKHDALCILPLNIGNPYRYSTI